MSRHLRFWSAAIALCAAGLIASPVPAVRGQAESTAPAPEGPVVSRIAQADQNADGYVDLTTLETSFASPSDRVLVFDGGGDMAVSEDWRTATDFENDTWVFDVGGDGRAELIVQFSRPDASAVEARIFDDVDGDGAVAFHVGAGTANAVITESGAPMLTVTSWPSWTRPDGGLNYNLRIVQDGTFGGQEGAPEFLRSMRRDGRPDHEWILADEDGDGIPEHRIGRMLLPTPETSGLHRMGIQVNSGRVRPRENGVALFWPLLGRSAADRTGNYFDTAPTIDVDWTTARVQDAGIVGYPIEHGFHVNAINYLRPDIRNIPNFENAMAYYDLDGDRDHRPELMVRHRYYEAGDRHGENVVPASNEIRYSWTERNPNGLIWDYKLGLAGRHVITDTVTIGGYDLAMVPHERLPTWVTERAWDLATFVAREGAGYASSEGIYEWAPIEDKSTDIVQIDGLTSGSQLSSAAVPYIRGSIATPPRGKFSGMRTGFRGEYAFEYGIRPMLYLSPVDRRVHLLRAEGGIWQVNPTSVVQYADDNRDGWIDAWTYLQVDAEGRIAQTRELHVLDDLTVYGDAEQVVLRQASVPPSTFEVVAPTTGEQVQALRIATEALGEQPGPGDLRQMQQQFEGAEQRIGGAQLRDFRRLAGGGYRFVMTVGAGHVAEGDGPLDVSGLAPGEYVVASTADGAVSIVPITEPSLTLEAWGESEGGRWLAADTSGLIRIVLTNLGLRDANDLTLRLERISDQGTVTPLGELPVDVLAGEPLQVALPWPPAPSGHWTIRVQVVGKDGVSMLDETREVNMPASAVPDKGMLSTELPSTATLLPSMVPLVLLALALGLVVAIALRSGEIWRRQP